jgi:fructose-1,6-bisphosphatase/inositol monophosphatase family enzyme
MQVDLMDRVATILRDVSATVIEPRFATLTDADIREKSLNDLVTVADEEDERFLTERLSEIFRGVLVVGEEACAADSSLLAALKSERAWLVDPLDGTSNFVSGSGHWAVMVALVEDGATVASWIWRPADRRMYMAERGGGACCNGKALRRLAAAPTDSRRLRGAVLPSFLDEATAAAISSNRGRFSEVTNGHRCAGIDYPLLIEGPIDFVLFWRTLPWDHAPGVLLVHEAGGSAPCLDGTLYSPTQSSVGLLAATKNQAWTLARRLLP